MRIIFSRTSSHGNCSVIESHSGDLIAVDCGLKYSDVNKAIGYKLHQCKTLLLSHAHIDHSKYVNDYRKRGMIVSCGAETAKTCKINGIYVGIHDRSQDESDGFRWIALPMVHTNASDGTDCECFGFLIQDKVSKERLLHCTDTAYIPYNFPPLDFINIETNYIEQDDYTDDLEAIERVVEQRRFKSHMSLQSVASFLAKQDLSKCKEIRLLHLSHSLTQAERDSIVPFIKNAIKRSDIPIAY